MYGYYTTWHVAVSTLGLVIPQVERKGIHLMSVLTTYQEKGC